MSENDVARITIEDTRVMLQIVESDTDDSKGIIYNHNMFIIQATGRYLDQVFNSRSDRVYSMQTCCY
jgi:hypothetical protein